LTFFPVLIMVESFAAAIFYLVSGKIGPAVYWFAAGFLNFAVIFLIPKGV